MPRRPAAGAVVGRMTPVKVALGQINPTIGDFEGNRRLVLEATAAAERQGAELAVFPELALAGYPPRDLLERAGFLDAAAASLAGLASSLASSRTAVVVGFPERLPPGPSGRAVANSAALIDGGRVTHVVRKSLLPTYDVFDEWRYFEPAAEVAPVPFRGRTLGLSICEDIWNDADFWPHRLYRGDPVETLVRAGAEIIVNISASPYTMQKRHLRPRMLASTAARWSRPLLFVNQVGGQDDLVFDGAQPGAGRARPGDRARRRARRRSGDGRRRRRTGHGRAVRSVRRTLGAGGAGAGHARLRAPVRLPPGAARAFGRDRLGAGRVHRRAGARSRAGARRRDAVALLVAGLARRRGGAGPRAGHRLLRRPDRADVRRLPRDAGGAAGPLRARALARRRGGRRRSDRPEPAGARARRDPDGAVQPAGSAAA